MLCIPQLGMLGRVLLPLLHGAVSVSEDDVVKREPYCTRSTHRNKSLPAVFTALQTSMYSFVLWCSSGVSQSALKADRGSDCLSPASEGHIIRGKHELA